MATVSPRLGPATARMTAGTTATKKLCAQVGSMENIRNFSDDKNAFIETIATIQFEILARSDFANLKE